MRIHSGWSQERLIQELSDKAGLVKPEKLKFWLSKLGYQKVRACTIDIPSSCDIYTLVKILKENRYQTTNLTLLGGMDREKLATLLASKLEIEKDTFLEMLDNGPFLPTYGFNDTTWPAFFLANTYNFAVSTTEEGFFQRMKMETDKFWNAERNGKAQKQGLSQLAVMTLASIVSKESNKTDEYEKIAGVYINRLRLGMRLQADPTVVFARKRSGRVLNADLKIESPYNTYEHAGLPPGPITIPNKASIEAVLNYQEHNYLYFVANYTFDGYHHFSPTLSEHLAWAAKLHTAMNKRTAAQRAGKK